MEKASAFPAKNLPAYMTVMGTMMLTSVVLWAAYLLVTTGTWTTGYFSEYTLELVFSFVMVMSGMMIMFVASLLNLRKMRKGWADMAAGKRDVRIPEVWCPVLTSAKDAAEQLMERTSARS